MLRECVLLVSVCVFGAGSLSGRGFFCRDPETGKLHAVNTTWPASAFCGNYHCKLRRKNITDTEYAPLRQVNITNIKLIGENLTILDIENTDTLIKKEEVVKSVVNTDKKTEPDINIDGLLTLKGDMGLKLDDNIDDKNETEKDRYLSDKEIRSLTEILHTVKKSDLDAIVEIYNLAQDIYKEIDKTSTDHVLKEAMITAKTIDNQITKSDILKKVIKHGHVSYWYEPLSSGKIRPADLMRSDMSRAETIRNDMVPVIPALPIDIEVPPPEPSIVNVAPKPPRSTMIPPTPSTLPLTANQMRRMTESFFNGALSHKDFGKLPYYYPMSSFQRMSSYQHEPPKQTQPESAIAQVGIPSYKTITYKPLYTGGKYQKEIKPSILLPYPFLNIHHYNWSHPQNLYHRNHLFDKLDTRRKNINQNPIKKHVQKQNNAVLMNPDLENFQDLEIRPTKQEEKIVRPQQNHDDERQRRKPIWQTESLPKQILDEVRAHIQEKQRLFIHPFPLRKKVKLERVGKLIKMDEATRIKRKTEEKAVSNEEPLEPELFEVYIEKTTCNSDYTVPGYFRYGNLSQPFPECCPQRIPTR